MQYYHSGYVNYNNNGFNNGMNCANGFHVYCHMDTQAEKATTGFLLTGTTLWIRFKLRPPSKWKHLSLTTT